jgi:hypothetical protein
MAFKSPKPLDLILLPHGTQLACFGINEVAPMLSEALPKLRSYFADVDTDSRHSTDHVHLWLRETLCALRGHDLLLHFERGRRVCLRCAKCGHETFGWRTR